MMHVSWFLFLSCSALQLSTSSTSAAVSSTHLRIQKTLRSSTTKKPGAPEAGEVPPQGRESAHAPKSFNELYTFGFNSDYYCDGRISDSPRKMRLTCTKNPQRKMNCQCDDQSGNSLQVKCRCGPSFTANKKHINLIDKFVAP